MRRHPSALSAHHFPYVLLAGALILTACTDSDYSLSHVDTTIGIGGDGLELPASSTETIKLRDVLELENGGIIVEQAGGDYALRLGSGPADPVTVRIDKVSVPKKTMDPVSLDVTVSQSATRRAGRTVSVSGDIVRFEYEGDRPDEVRRLVSADVSGEAVLRLAFPASLHAAVPVFSTLSITFPSYMTVADRGSVPSPVVTGRTLTYTDVPTDRDLTVRVSMQSLRFDMPDSGADRVRQSGGKITAAGHISLQAAGPLMGSVTGGLGAITSTVTTTDLVIDGVQGYFSPDVRLDGLGDVQVTGVPDFLSGGNVVADLYNPQVLLTLDGDLPAECLLDGTLTAYKDGAVTARVEVPGIRVTPSGDATVCICRTAEGVTGYGNVSVVPALSTLIRTIPDRITFAAAATANADRECHFFLGHDYRITPSYAVDAPLALAADARIVYRDTLSGWHDDIQDYRLADDARLVVTASVTNCIPAYMTVEARPVDADGQPIGSSELEVTVDGTVAASADGVTPAVSPLTMTLVQKDPDALRRLDGLVFTVSGTADGTGGAVTGITLNAERHTLRINDIKIKIVGKVIADFN